MLHLSSRLLSGLQHAAVASAFTLALGVTAPVLAQPAPAAVPPGMALVPIEPTPEMVDAGDVARHSVVTQARTSVIYRAMIAAAGDKT